MTCWVYYTARTYYSRIIDFSTGNALENLIIVSRKDVNDYIWATYNSGISND